MILLAWFLVIFLTSLLAFWLGCAVTQDNARPERDRLLAELDQATANVQVLPRAGRLEQPFAGAADPAQQIPSPSPIIPWDLAGAAYVLGQVRADQDATSREVEAIFAEVEFDPKWRHT